MVDGLSVTVRAVSFVLLFQAAGIAIFVTLFGEKLSASLTGVRRLGHATALVGAMFVAAHYALEAARMAGDFAGLSDSSLQGMVWHSSARAALIMRLLGLALVAFALRHGGNPKAILALLGAVLACLAFALTGHTSVSTHRPALAGLLMIHLFVVSFWFGALVPLYLASARETSARAWELTERFTRVATWAVPVIFVAGITMAFLLLPNAAALREPYGQLLIAKVVGFTLLMGLAALNKWRLGPALAQGTAQSGRRFRRAVAIEYVLIVAVLTITAVMTSFYSPEA